MSDMKTYKLPAMSAKSLEQMIGKSVTVIDDSQWQISDAEGDYLVVLQPGFASMKYTTGFDLGNTKSRAQDQARYGLSVAGEAIKGIAKGVATGVVGWWIANEANNLLEDNYVITGQMQDTDSYGDLYCAVEGTVPQIDHESLGQLTIDTAAYLALRGALQIRHAPTRPKTGLESHAQALGFVLGYGVVRMNRELISDIGFSDWYSGACQSNMQSS
ncbi:MAG: hypothetical protein HGA85_07970 [Nanoarchaeota archaeon]|nr:hypothetical protein [Nanoarchaeota archaeon]